MPFSFFMLFTATKKRSITPISLDPTASLTSSYIQLKEMLYDPSLVSMDWEVDANDVLDTHRSISQQCFLVEHCTTIVAEPVATESEEICTKDG